MGAGALLRAPHPRSPASSPAGAAASSCKAAPPSCFCLYPLNSPWPLNSSGFAGTLVRGDQPDNGRREHPPPDGGFPQRGRGRWPSPDACALGLGPGAGRVLTYPGTSLWSGELPTHCVVRETGVELVLPSSGGSGKPCPAFGVCLYECHRGAAILAVSSAHTSTPSHTCCSDVRSHLFSPRLHPLWSSCWSRENRDLSGTADSTFGGVLNTTPPAAPTRPRPSPAVSRVVAPQGASYARSLQSTCVEHLTIAGGAEAGHPELMAGRRRAHQGAVPGAVRAAAGWRTPLEGMGCRETSG